MSTYGSFLFTVHDNTNWAQCSDASFVNNKTNCSFSIWFKKANATMPLSDGILWGNLPYDTGHGGMGTLIYSTTGAVAGAISSELFQTAAASFARVTGTTNLCDNTWHNLISTFDKAAGFKIYVDGVLATVTTDGGSPNVDYTTASNFSLGNGTNKSATMLDANMALFQVWNSTTLSQANATAIAAGGTNVASPTASWPFNEGSGTVATDTVGGKTFTFQGANSSFSWSTDIPSQLIPAFSAKQKAATNLVI